MKLNRETLDKLAAEYVLGTLIGSARTRFEKLALGSREARESIWRWERTLNQQVAILEAEIPHNRVWARIEDRIRLTETPHRKTELRWWQAASLALSLVVAALLLPGENTPPALPQSGPEQLALFQADAEPLWVVSIDAKSGRLRSRAVNVPAKEIDRAFELWMLVDGVPQSLGLLPVSGEPVENYLSPALVGLLQRASGLAISLEPAGGSPTGAPTGPVLYQAPVLSL